MLLKNEKIPMEDFLCGINSICYPQAASKAVDYECIVDPVLDDYYIGDAMKLQQVLINILSNAIKYTPSGGSVMVNIDELVCDEPGYMMVRTRVSDTGIGMSQDYLTKIFDAFTRERNTTKSKITGSGLKRFIFHIFAQ